MFLSLFICLTAVAQESKISGTVTDAADGLPMIGVNVQIKGTTIGTITDADGTFSLQAPSHESVLLLTSIGYKPIELKVGNKRIFKIKMEEDAELLDEIVVVGYGTQRKKDLSGAVSQLKSDDLMKSSPADFSKGMQGKIAGVIINQNDGAPGAGVSIQIRGTKDRKSVV